MMLGGKNSILKLKINNQKKKEKKEIFIISSRTSQIESANSTESSLKTRLFCLFFCPIFFSSFELKFHHQSIPSPCTSSNPGDCCCCSPANWPPNICALNIPSAAASDDLRLFVTSAPRDIPSAPASDDLRLFVTSTPRDIPSAVASVDLRR